MPWTVNGPENMSYLKGALTDMLSSRIGSDDTVEVLRKDEVRSAIAAHGHPGERGQEAAIEIGKSIKADYLIYGSLSILGGSVSLDTKLLNVASTIVMPFYSSGEGLSSIVDLAGSVSRATLESIRADSGVTGSDLSYVGKFNENGAGRVRGQGSDSSGSAERTRRQGECRQCRCKQ